MLAPVERAKGGGGPTADQKQRWKAWRKARKSFEHDPAQDPAGEGIPDITYPHLGKRTLGHVEKPPSAVQRLQDRPTDLLGVWRQDPTPTHPFGLDKFKGSQGAHRGQAITPQRAAGLRVLAEHSRHHFRAYNDKRRMIGSLPLQERLFMFYKRADRRMIPHIAAVAAYWIGEERTLEKVLKHKYKSNLEEEGLGPESELMINVDVLLQEMNALHAQMSAEVVPESNWIPQHSNHLAPIALRDAVLLASAEVHLPITELDADVRASFLAADERSSRPIPFPSPPSANTTVDSQESPDRDAEKFRIALSLKEHIIGFRRQMKLSDDSPMDSPRAGSSRGGMDPSRASTPETISTLGGLSRMQTPLATTHRGAVSDSLMPEVSPSRAAPSEQQAVTSEEAGARLDELANKGLVAEVEELEDKRSGHAARPGIAAGADLKGSSRGNEGGEGAAARPGGEMIKDDHKGQAELRSGVEIAHGATDALDRRDSPAASHSSSFSYQSPGSPSRPHHHQELPSPIPHSDEAGPAVRPATAEGAGGRDGAGGARERRVFTATLSPLREKHSIGAGGHGSLMRPSTAPEVGVGGREESSLSASFANRAENWMEMTSTEYGMPFWYNKCTGESRWNPPAKRAYEEEMDASHFKQTRRHQSKSGMKRVSKEEERVLGAFERVPSDGGSEGSAFSRTASLRGAVGKVMMANSFVRAASKGSAGKELLTLDDDSDAGSEKGGDKPKTVQFEIQEVQEQAPLVQKPRGMRLVGLLDGEFMNSREHRVNQKRRKEKPQITKQQRLVMRMQAWARGYLVRKDMNIRKMQGLEWGRRQMAVKLQRWWRRYLHWREMAKQRKVMGGLMAQGLFGPMQVRIMGKRWLRKTRERLRRELEAKSALVIQRHFRGMQGIKRVRRIKQQRLVDACVSVQRAWRKKMEWIKFVKEEERKALKEANRLRKEYLFGGKSNAELRKLREHALDDFEENTSDLGRSKAHDHLDAEAGKTVKPMEAFDTWMATLRALMQKEKEDDDSEGAAAAAKKKRPGGIAGVLAYTKNSNPEHIEHSIYDQRVDGPQGPNRKLILIDMKPKMLRWPFGVSDDQMGKPPWMELRTVYVSKNKLKGLPYDFFKLTNLTDLRLDHNLMTNLAVTVSQLTNLRTLWLHNNELETLPIEVSVLQELSFLSVNDNKIRAIPFEIAVLTNLAKLPLHNNPPIVSPPTEMAAVSETHEGCCKVLEYLGKFRKGLKEPFVLDLSGFSIINIPNLERVGSCQVMNFSRNALKTLEERLMWDTHHNLAWHNKLRELDLSSNALKKFPHVLTRLVSLVQIDVSDNNIAELPAEIRFLTRLMTLKAEGNPLSSPTLTVVHDGVETYVIRGSEAHAVAMGTYNKTPAWLNDRPVFELLKRGTVSKLYLAVVNGHQSWCIGPNTQVDDAFLRVHDGALLPSAVTSTWTETQPSLQVERRRKGGKAGVEKRMYRNANISVKGIGLQEYFTRVLQYREFRSMCLKMKDAMQANEEIADMGGRSEEEKEAMRRFNREKFKEASRKLILNCSYLSLEIFPKEICDQNLRELILDNNILEDLPSHLFKVPLVRLSVCNNRIVTLDEKVGGLKRLEELIVSGNYLTTLPATLSNLGALKILDFSKNEVEILPDAIGKLQGLQSLDYAQNKVETLPMFLTGMESLSTFRGSRNQISSLGPTNADFTDKSACALSHIPSITCLDLGDNKLDAIPQPLRALTALKTLNLSDNLFVDLSPAQAIFNSWEGLSSLNLRGNRLRTLPTEMRACKLLETVDLSFNWFEEMPVGVCTLPLLKKLDVRKNFLSRLPADICMLTNLEELDASENGLKHVAPELRMLTNMVTLNLSKNALEYLPPALGMTEEVLGKLCKLRVLDISNNILPMIPLDVAKCSNLTDLHVYGNGLKHPALIRAQVPCFGSLSVRIEEVSDIIYLNKRNQTARKYGNPMCTVGLEGGKSGTVQQLQTTTCKVETNNPFFQQSFPFVIRDCYQTMACKLNTKPLDAQRLVDQSAPMTPLRGLQVRIPVLSSVLYQQPAFNFFSFESLAKAVDGCCVLIFRANEDIVCMGDKADALIILVAGQASVSQTEPDGRETILRELLPGQIVGELSLLCGDPFSVTVSAVEDAIVVKVPLSAMSPVFRNQPNKSVECLLYHEAIEYHKHDAERAEEQKDVVWGSKEWNKLRAKENESLYKRVEQMCHAHIFSHDQTNSVKSRIQTIADKMNDNGESVYVYAKDESYVDLNVALDFAPYDEVSHKKGDQAQDPQDAIVRTDASEDTSMKEDIGKQGREEGTGEAEDRKEAPSAEDAKRHDPNNDTNEPPTEEATGDAEAKVGSNVNETRQAPENSAAPGPAQGPSNFKLPPNPSLKMRLQFFCNDRVEPFRVALREIAEAKEPDKYAIAMLRSCTAGVSAHSVRKTPEGFLFDIEGDWLRDDAEVERIDAYIRQFHNDKRVNRGAPVWEKMPLMFFVDGVFDREWDRAADRRAEYSSGNFREMGNIVEKMSVDGRVSDLKPKTPHRNQWLWREIERFGESNYQRQSIPEEGESFSFFKENPPPRNPAVRADPVESWRVLTGLLLVKPQALLEKERIAADLPFQEQQLSAVRALQEHAGMKLQLRAYKAQLAKILEDIDRHRAKIKAQFEVLREGWNGDAVAVIKAARKAIDGLEKEFEFVNESKSRVKALYKLRGSSSSALSWKGSQALDKVWDAVVQYTDPYVDDVLAESNARGGPMEAELVAKVTVADTVPTLDLIQVEDVVKWVDQDEALAKIRRNAELIKAALLNQQITGRMLMHLAKEDLMRMGIQGHVARLVLLRVEDFKRRYHVGTPDPLIEKQHALSAEFALLESEDEMHNFLKNQFELEDRQVKQFRKVFSKWDVEGRGEISVSDLTGAVASCGAKLHPQILKAIKKKFDPGDSGTVDIVCFAQINKMALMAGQ